jgi:phosphoglycolate phosphatase-like HAD superfamily hydrolase
VIAAGKLGIPTIAIRTGGFSVDELREAGAAMVYDSLTELRQSLDDTALGRPS